MPLATKHRHGINISAQLVTPFSFLLGRRSNLLSPASLPNLPNSKGDLLDNLHRASEGMYSFFTENIPNMILRPAKHNIKRQGLAIDDIVLFPYVECKLGSQYKLGIVTSLEFNNDDQA